MPRCAALCRAVPCCAALCRAVCAYSAATLCDLVAVVGEWVGRDAQSHSEGSRNEGAAHSAHNSTATEGDVHGGARRPTRRPPHTSLLLNGLLRPALQAASRGEACTHRTSMLHQPSPVYLLYCLLYPFTLYNLLLKV